jgi:hypothetical protein
VKSAPAFAVGGVGYAGIKAQEELAVLQICAGADAEQQLRKLLQEASPAGQMYALFGLRQIESPHYAALALPYRLRTDPVDRKSGCVGYSESMRESVEWIDHAFAKSPTSEKKHSAVSSAKQQG